MGCAGAAVAQGWQDHRQLCCRCHPSCWGHPGGAVSGEAASGRRGYRCCYRPQLADWHRKGATGDLQPMQLMLLRCLGFAQGILLTSTLFTAPTTTQRAHSASTLKLMFLLAHATGAAQEGAASSSRGPAAGAAAGNGGGSSHQGWGLLRLALLPTVIISTLLAVAWWTTHRRAGVSSLGGRPGTASAAPGLGAGRCEAVALM